MPLPIPSAAIFIIGQTLRFFATRFTYKNPLCACFYLDAKHQRIDCGAHLTGFGFHSFVVFNILKLRHLVGFQIFHRNKLKGFAVRGFQNDGWCHACLQGFFPSKGTQAPNIAGF